MALIYQAATIVLAGVLLAGVDSIRRPVKTRPDAPQPAPIGTTAGVPEAMGLDITVAQAHALFGQKAAFIDARSKAEYEAGHVEGAFHLPLDVFAGNAVPDAVSAIDGAGPVVVYCTGGDCHASHDVVIKLQQIGANMGLGFKRCHVLKDGYPGWTGAGHPIATGPGPLEGGQ